MARSRTSQGAVSKLVERLESDLQGLAEAKGGTEEAEAVHLLQVRPLDACVPRTAKTEMHICPVLPMIRCLFKVLGNSWEAGAVHLLLSVQRPVLPCTGVLPGSKGIWLASA